jgi:hypothetical protein
MHTPIPAMAIAENFSARKADTMVKQRLSTNWIQPAMPPDPHHEIFYCADQTRTTNNQQCEANIRKIPGRVGPKNPPLGY